jgi:hypothetical protein
MKIALIQLDVHDNLWKPELIPALIEKAAGADLVVFPECMPFDDIKNPPLIEDAKELLVKLGNNFGDTAFMAGGYVKDKAGVRNVVFLVYNGRVTDYYFKQIKWHEEIVPGDQMKVFKWGKKFEYACIPLICADAGDYSGVRKTTMMAKAVNLEEDLNVHGDDQIPIVICSYGGGLRTPYWHRALSGWTTGTNAPVVICGVSGRSHKYTYFDLEGKQQKMGGGGSGVFWPDGEIDQVSFRGVFILDTEHRTMDYRNLSKCACDC